MRRDPNPTGAPSTAATEADMVELLVDLLLAVPADEFDGDIGAAYVLGTLEASQGLLVETDDGSVFHVGITAVR